MIGAKDVLILGLGGLGFQGLGFAKAMFGGDPLGADIKPGTFCCLLILLLTTDATPPRPQSS